MKRRCWGLAATILCLALSLSACRMPPEEIPNFLDGVATGLGNSQITMDMELIGERTGGTDAYTGTYRSDCAGDTGRDVVFGGGSIKSRQLYLHGVVRAEAGNAMVLVRQNENVMELEPQEDGSFETTLHLQSGGNYIMVSYEDFQGEVELVSEYESAPAQKEERACTANCAMGEEDLRLHLLH